MLNGLKTQRQLIRVHYIKIEALKNTKNQIMKMEIW